MIKKRKAMLRPKAARTQSHEIQLAVQEHKIYRSASIYIKNEVERAVKQSTIEPQEAAISAKVLIAAGVQAIKRRGRSSRITKGDIVYGWQHYVSICAPNQPPHRCLRRSALERMQELKDRSEIFARILGEGE